MKTIYNTYVEIESQEQADRMKQLCIDNGLKYSRYNNSFTRFYSSEVFVFNGIFFTLLSSFSKKHTKVTEQEFINLLKETK